MKIRSIHFSLVSFMLAFSLMIWWKTVNPTAVVAVPLLEGSVPHGNSEPTTSAASPLPPLDRASSDAALPYSKQEDARLMERCRSLTATDPEAAFRSGMACWQFAGKSLAAAAEALVKKDPAAAHRLLAECPDLRAKSILEGELMADEVRRHPEEKLRWAEANLEGNVRVKAMNAGSAALAAKNPAAALEILSEWPPSLMKLGGQFKALGARMKEDATAALTWASENTDPSGRDFTGIQACLNFIKQNPTEGLAILPSLPVEYREHMGFAMVWQAKSDSPQPLQPMMDALRALPGDVQLPVIRLWAAELLNEQVNSQNELLAALSDPAERATAIEVMTLKQLSSFDSNSKQPEVLDWLGQFQTPADKKSAARVVPYLDSLTETQRQDILSRLK